MIRDQMGRNLSRSDLRTKLAGNWQMRSDVWRHDGPEVVGRSQTHNRWNTSGPLPLALVQHKRNEIFSMPTCQLYVWNPKSDSILDLSFQLFKWGQWLNMDLQGCNFGKNSNCCVKEIYKKNLPPIFLCRCGWCTRELETSDHPFSPQHTSQILW